MRIGIVKISLFYIYIVYLLAGVLQECINKYLFKLRYTILNRIELLDSALYTTINVS